MASDNSSLNRHPNLDEWISIGTDGRITITNGKVDIGQRISTAIALLAAEELDVDYDRIDVIAAETGLSTNEGMTSGSNSMDESGNAIRLAAATARHHLLALAAKALDVNVSTLDVDDGLVQSRDTNRSATYWDLAGGKKFEIEIDLEADVKSPDAHSQIGMKAKKRVAARGMQEIATGGPRFIQDMKLPGMLHARMVRPPHYHARLKGLDDAVQARLADTGVTITRDGSFLAVSAADEYAAIKAGERLAATADWDLGDGLEAQDIFERLPTNERVSRPVIKGTPKDEPIPDMPPIPGDAAITLNARYEKPYHMHGSIGPSAALAVFEDGQLSVWTHSQGIYVLRTSMAEALGLDEDAVRLIHTPGSGCYGHNGADDAAMEAALVAQANPGAPILLKWSRDDEHAWEPYGTCMTMDLTASVNADGAVLNWNHESYGDTYSMRPRAGANQVGPRRLIATHLLSEPLEPLIMGPTMGRHVGIHRNQDPLYAFPETRIIKHLVRGLPLRTSALRALGAYGNVFAIESFMDELAEAAGVDPVEFRLRHLEDERGKAVLSEVAKKMSAWTHGGDGSIGQGVAFAQYKNNSAYAAVGIEVEVNDAAEIRLLRAVIAADAGQVVDPDGLIAQFEGGLIQAASWTLHEAVQFDSSGITSRDWDSYPILRFDNIPEVETILIDRREGKFLGAGEATAGPTAAAIANAIKQATGLRLRRLPFTPDAIRAAALQ
jgi:nicotinate dehydrogenase subunit B